MSEDKDPKLSIADILARKRHQQGVQPNKFGHDNNFKGKINKKGFGGPAGVRKTGRGS